MFWMLGIITCRAKCAFNFAIDITYIVGCRYVYERSCLKQFQILYHYNGYCIFMLIASCTHIT